jgi:Kef-type K+ transport system membrane component KefB
MADEELRNSGELRARRSATLVGYLAMMGVAVAVALGVHRMGASLLAPEAPAGAALFGAPMESHSNQLARILFALVVIIALSRLLGALFRRLRQPPVIGEVIAGIVLGPSLFGRLAPEWQAWVLPRTIAPSLGTIAQIGVILFMFLVGLELDTSLLRKKTHATLAISHASIVAPFLLGTLAALVVYPVLGTRDVPFTIFSLFLGVSMSVTAFPVLARILTDLGLHRTPLGVIAISCAAVDDVTAWCLLALVVSLAQSQMGGALFTLVGALAYVLVMLTVVRPGLAWLVRRQELLGKVTSGSMGIVFVTVLVSALATETLGLHALFGAFLAGAIVPHDSLLARGLTSRLEDLVVVLFLPAFFAFTGMRTELGLVSGSLHWAIFAGLFLVACLGKFGGTAIAARLSGLDWRDSSSLGVLMNTRGLMELIVLNLGLDLHVISPTLFAMMVLMAVGTTMMTTPALVWLNQKKGAPEGALESA